MSPDLWRCFGSMKFWEQQLKTSSQRISTTLLPRMKGVAFVQCASQPLCSLFKYLHGLEKNLMQGHLLEKPFPGFFFANAERIYEGDSHHIILHNFLLLSFGTCKVEEVQNNTFLLTAFFVFTDAKIVALNRVLASLSIRVYNKLWQNRCDYCRTDTL